jgi:hypothetical protein
MSELQADCHNLTMLFAGLPLRHLPLQLPRTTFAAADLCIQDRQRGCRAAAEIHSASAAADSLLRIVILLVAAGGPGHQATLANACWKMLTVSLGMQHLGEQD